MNKPHDHAYKRLFSEPELVVDLLQGFVQEPWVGELDFTTLEKVSGSYVSDDLRDRETDVIWRVRYRENWIYVYLLIEFQSTIDKYMAVRIMTYMGLLYQDLIETKQLLADKRLPPIFPVVLYNGESRWNAKTELSDLIVELPGGLEQYRPSLKYLILDEGAYKFSKLPLKNLVAAIFRLENATSYNDILNVVSNLLEWLTTPEQTRLRRSFTIWINRVLTPSSRFQQPAPEITDLVEMKAMLAERIPQWHREMERKAKEEGKAQGVAQGETRGKAIGELKYAVKTLLRQLELRFGSLSNEVEQKVHAASKKQLDCWLERIITADTIEDVFA